MAAIDRPHRLRRRLVWRLAGDSQSDLVRSLAGFLFNRFALDQDGLTDMREVEIGIERRAAPDAPRLDAAMVRRRHLLAPRLVPGIERPIQRVRFNPHQTIADDPFAGHDIAPVLAPNRSVPASRG